MDYKSNNYIPAIDGLRAISIILVFLSHLLTSSKLMTTSPVPGGLGVTIFFFISGYLITNLLLSEFARSHEINLKSFYIRRILRLYPPLLAMMILITIFLWLTHKIIPFKELMAALFYYENYFLAYSNAPSVKYAILWSLAVEEHFYLIYPLILLMFIRKIKYLFAIIIVLTIIPFIFRLLTVYYYGVNEISFSFINQVTHCRFDSILYGCITSILIFSDYKKIFLELVSSKYIYTIFLVMFCFTLIYRNEFFRQTIRFSIQGISFMVLIPPIIYTESFGKLNKVLSSKKLVLVGKLSYSIYLFHFVAIELLYDLIFKNAIVYIFVNIILSVILSTAGYYYIEIPMMKLRRRFGSNVRVNNLKV